MYIVGLTGGIGSGKSTVARLFAERGAVVVDADLVAREVVLPGEPALQELVAEFGDGILLPDGTLDRPGLAAIAFATEEARRRLNAITHPRINARIAEQVMDAHVAAAADGEPDRVLILDIPLLTEGDLARGYREIVVVTAPEDVRVQRLVEFRGMDADDARARMRAQTTDEERATHASHVIDNSGDLPALEPQVAEVWEALTSAASADAAERAAADDEIASHTAARRAQPDPATPEETP